MFQPDNTAEAEPALDSRENAGKPFFHTVKSQSCSEVRSGYLVNRLSNTPDNNLFNFVKFNLISQHIKSTHIPAPRIMDIGCGLQVAKRFLTTLNPGVAYFGADYEPTFKPDAVIDLNQAEQLATPMLWNPDVVMLLDVLEHLHEEESNLRAVVRNIASSVPMDARVIITVPQMYRLDRFKLNHLNYPEHKIRLTQTEWRNIIEEHFDIVSSQGVGYLSVLPYLPMAFRSFTPDNTLGRLFMHLRSSTFEKQWIKKLDLFLSNTLGRLAPCKYLSNDILFVASPRRNQKRLKT